MLLFGCLFTLEASAQAQKGDDAYRSVLEQYMVASGSMASYDAMLDMLFQSMPQLTEAKQQEIRKKAAARLIDQLMPAYKRYLSVDDLKAAMAFYATPAGQRIQKSQQPLMQDAMQVGHKFGMELQQMIMEAM